MPVPFRSVTYHASAQETANGSGTGQDTWDVSTMSYTLSVTASSGAGTLTVFIEDSTDNATWTTLATFTPQAVGANTAQAARPLTPKARYTRTRWTCTATFTFSVIGNGERLRGGSDEATALIDLARDESFFTIPGTANADTAKYYWTDPSTWRMSAGASWIQTYIQYLDRSSSSVRIRVLGQWSLDGKNWNNFGQDLQQGSSLTALGRTQTEYSGGLNGFEFGPYVRYGVYLEVAGGSTEEQWARLSVTVKVHGVSVQNVMHSMRGTRREVLEALRDDRGARE